MAKLYAQVATARTKGHREVVKLTLRGIISAPTLGKFRQVMEKALNSGRDALLDLRGVTYVNSSGLSEIVRAHDALQKNNLCLLLANLDPEVKRLLVLLGLRSLLLVYPDAKAALASLDRGIVTQQAFSPGDTTRFFINKGNAFVPVKEPPAAKLPEARILLCINGDPRFAGFLSKCLSGGTEKAVLAGTLAEAERALAGGKIDLAIIDATLPDCDDICAAVKLNRENGLAAVILIKPTGAVSARLPGADARVLADENAVEPFEVRELVVMAQGEYSRCRDESILFVQEATLNIPTREQALAHAHRTLEEALGESGLAEKARDEFLYAVREAMDNSRRHGNGNDVSKAITVQYVLDKEKVTVTVTDEGKGFDYMAALAGARSTTPVEQARLKHGKGEVGGLGIGLMVRCCDKLEYGHPGNSVRLTRYL